MYIANTIAYVRWFNEDCYETRQAIRKTYLYILIQTIILYVGLIIIIYEIPADALPDSYEDNFGNVYEFPPDRKKDMKNFALYLLIVLSIFTIWF